MRRPCEKHGDKGLHPLLEILKSDDEEGGDNQGIHGGHGSV
jgi:hypothetical protein